MYSLFNAPVFGGGGPVITFPSYEYALKGIRLDLNKVIKYNRIYPTAVPGNHFLVKLIQNLNLNFTLEPMVYRDRVEETAEAVSMMMNITSSLHKGRMFSPGVFYGKGSNEVIIAHSEDFDLSRLESDWEDYEPIKFLTHPKSDLGIHVPMGHGAVANNNFTVITINIPMLACQYRQWRLRERLLNAEAQRTTTQFVYSYPLTNALRSQLDVALWNRFTTIYNGGLGDDNPEKHSFATTDFTSRTDKAFVAMSVEFHKRKLSFDDALSFIKVVSEPTFREVLRIPAMSPTRQVVWGLVLSRLAVIKFLLTWNATTNNPKNGQYLKTIRLELQRLLNDGALRSSFSAKSAVYLENELYNLLGMV